MISEASYRGNLGVMELIQFVDMATPNQKELFQKLIDQGKNDKALELVQRVTKTRLQISGGKSRNLMAFDFDNTLVTTDAKTIVTHADGTSTELDPFEFPQYKKQPGDRFDFSEFDTVKNAREIEKYTRIFKAAIADPKTEVVVVTARSNAQIIAQYFKSALGIDRGVKIKALGSANPRAKLRYLRNKLATKNYSDLMFFDDSPENTDVVRRLNKEFPEYL